MRSQVSCTLDSAPGDGEWLHSIYSQSLDDTKLMNLCKLCVSIFYLFFVFSNKKKKKKSFKNEKGHAGHTWRYWSNASAHFACCRPLLYSYATVSAPARVQQHVPSALSCTPSALRFLFFFFFLIALHTDTAGLKVLFLSQREVISNYWGGFFMDVSVFFPPPSIHWQSCILSFSLVFPIVCVSYKCLLKIARVDA